MSTIVRRKRERVETVEQMKRAWEANKLSTKRAAWLAENRRGVGRPDTRGWSSRAIAATVIALMQPATNPTKAPV